MSTKEDIRQQFKDELILVAALLVTAIIYFLVTWHLKGKEQEFFRYFSWACNAFVAGWLVQKNYGIKILLGQSF